MSLPYLENAVLIGQGADRFKTIARGAANTVLTQGTLGAEPAFAAPAAVSLTTGVSGTLPVANGGTGVATLAANGVLLGNTTSPLAVTTAGAADTVLRVPGAGGAPAFGAVDLTKAAAVTGALLVANGGTGQTVGAVASMQFWGLGVLASTTTFLGPGAGAEADVQFPCPFTGTVVWMTIAVSVAPGGSDTFTYRIRLAGANSGNTAVITAAETAASGTQALAVTRDQLLCVRLISSLTAATANHKLTLALRVDG